MLKCCTLWSALCVKIHWWWTFRKHWGFTKVVDIYINHSYCRYLCKLHPRPGFIYIAFRDTVGILSHSGDLGISQKTYENSGHCFIMEIYENLILDDRDLYWGDLSSILLITDTPLSMPQLLGVQTFATTMISVCYNSHNVYQRDLRKCPLLS